MTATGAPAADRPPVMLDSLAEPRLAAPPVARSPATAADAGRSWVDAAWLCGVLVGGWLATAAPVGRLLAMAGLFVAIFCAVRLDQPHSRREGYQRGYADGAHAADASAIGPDADPPVQVPRPQ